MTGGYPMFTSEGPSWRQTQRPSCSLGWMFAGLLRGQITQTLSGLGKRHYSRVKLDICKMADYLKIVLESVAEVSTIKQATITGVEDNPSNGKKVGVEVLWSCFDLAGSERTCTLSNYVVQNGSVMSYQPVPSSKNVVLRQTSHSGRLTACVMKSEKDKDAEYMMVMKQEGYMTTINLKAADKHGKVYADEDFSCLEWSPDETTVVYVAEKKWPKPSSFFTPLKKGSEDGRGQEFIYRNDWGEQMKEKHQAVVCFLNVKTKELNCHELPDKLCAGQIVWTPDGSGVFGVAYKSQPFRLGVICCPNRESKLFHMDLNGNFTVITKGCSNIRTPRVSPDGGQVAFLRSKVGGAHANCSQLCLLSWPSKQVKVVVDVVERQKFIHDDRNFFGIYGYSGLPRRCWLNDSERLVISTISNSDVIPYVIHIANGTIVEMPHKGSHQVVDVLDDYLLLNVSTIARPNQILLGRVPAMGQEVCIELKPVTALRDIPTVPSLEYGVKEFINDTPHPNPKYSDIKISFLYYGPVANTKGTPKRPLICWPHGGPHSTSCNSYSMAPIFFVALGYSVVMVNYRGSLGYGQDGIDSLLGHCGLTDVDDVHKATLNCLNRYSDVLDESQVFLVGGSHGGFLATHLSAQYPKLYKAAVLRNASCDFTSALAGKDNPDLTFVECGFTYEDGKVPDGATLSKMLEMSPINRIDSIKAPTLFLVGKNDARVPPAQSLNFHRLLLARGIETELHLYDDCHPLSKVEVDADSLIHTALWLEKHRTKVTS
ncbi:Acylamino-acid-releasing enzyme [Chionoecetes opilio]|uniref:Acylamino-acid-releasing enzyme n=1 Tax=Chionoecetes opilio TaxID=41210 RepID=A0A8J4YB50_CHIOP|nr:Acylamino-acid-releasing enzyme [Chionoecetes opilio]